MAVVNAATTSARGRRNAVPNVPDPTFHRGVRPPSALPSDGGSRIAKGTVRREAMTPILSHYLHLMRIHVDSDKCQGHNRCYALAPELFDVDDYGNAVVIGDGNVPAELEERARLALANCPEFAITITE